MRTGGRLTGFGAVVAVVFGAALLVGQAVGPVREHEALADGPHSGSHAGTSSHPDAAEDAATGLVASQDGYSLDLARTTLEPGPAVPVSFTISGPDGSPVTSFEVQHEKQLHLIVVRRDLTGFQHLHPTRSGGRWTSDVALTAGVWRVFADFKPAGASALTLGADLSVRGQFDAVAPGPDSRTAVVDGFTVALSGDLRAGADAVLRLSVSRHGNPVTDLEPYLGAYGHLVVLRSGDLTYLHAHPDGEPHDGTTEPGPDVVFHTTVSSPGTYHLYLDFKHGGVVRTAAFTLTAAR